MAEELLASQRTEMKRLMGALKRPSYSFLRLANRIVWGFLRRASASALDSA